MIGPVPARLTPILLCLVACAVLVAAPHRVESEGQTGGIAIVQHLVDASDREVDNADLAGYAFTITGPGIGITHSTSGSGAITILGLMPGAYTITEAPDPRSAFSRIAVLDQTALQNGAAISVEAGVAVIVDVYNLVAAPSAATVAPSIAAAAPSGVSVIGAPSSINTVVLQLLPGINNVPYLGPTRPVADAFRSIAGQYTQILAWDAAAQRWISYDPSNTPSSELQVVSRGSAYLVTVTGKATVVIDSSDFSVLSAPLVLRPGFNNVVYRGPSGPLPDSLGSLASRLISVGWFDAAAQSWKVYSPGPSGRTDITALIHDNAYFINLSGP